MAVFAIARLFHTSPMKNVYHHYITSHLSNLFPDASLSPKPLSDMLYATGLSRQMTVDFMKEFVSGSLLYSHLKTCIRLSSGWYPAA